MQKLISPKEFARRNGVSRTTFYRIIGRGDLKAVKVGRRTFVTAQAEQAWRAALPAWQPATDQR